MRSVLPCMSFSTNNYMCRQSMDNETLNLHMLCFVHVLYGKNYRQFAKHGHVSARQEYCVNSNYIKFCLDNVYDRNK